MLAPATAWTPRRNCGIQAPDPCTRGPPSSSPRSMQLPALSPFMYRLRTLRADDDHRVLTCNNIVVGIENTPPTITYIDCVFGAIRDLAEEYGGGIGLMAVIRSDARPPDDMTRRHIIKVLTEMSGSMGGFAHVVEGEGFVAAAKRSALSLLVMAARTRFPLKIFRSPAEGLPWLITTLGGEQATGLSTRQLLGELTRLRDEQFAKTPMLG